MTERMHRSLKYLRRWCAVSTLVFGMLVLFSDPGWGKSRGPYGPRDFLEGPPDTKEFLSQHRNTLAGRGKKILIARKRKKGSAPQTEDRPRRYRDVKENLTPEEKARLKRKHRQWQSMPPEKKRDMRRRMKRWKKLSPEDRALYRQRFRQWQKLSPEERQRIRKNLERGNGLTSEEKEKIRRKFRQ